MTDKHPLDGKLEPEAKPIYDANTAALTSIAISLKRIADNMERVEVHGAPGPISKEALKKAFAPIVTDALHTLKQQTKRGIR